MRLQLTLALLLLASPGGVSAETRPSRATQAAVVRAIRPVVVRHRGPGPVSVNQIVESRLVPSSSKGHEIVALSMRGLDFETRILLSARVPKGGRGPVDLLHYDHGTHEFPVRMPTAPGRQLAWLADALSTYPGSDLTLPEHIKRHVARDVSPDEVPAKVRLAASAALGKLPLAANSSSASPPKIERFTALTNEQGELIGYRVKLVRFFPREYSNVPRDGELVYLGPGGKLVAKTQFGRPGA